MLFLFWGRGRGGRAGVLGSRVEGFEFGGGGL